MIPDVTVIVPVFRTEAYLPACLGSLQRQTLASLEILCIDDCSPDRSAEIVESKAERDSRIVLVRHEANRGLGAARNTGLERAQGRFVMFLDSDDRFPVDACQQLVLEADRTGADLVVGRMLMEEDHSFIPVEYIDRSLDRYHTEHESNLRRIPETATLFSSVCHKLFRRSVIEDHGLRFEEGCYWEDISFSYRFWYFSKQIRSIWQPVLFRTIRQDEANQSITQIRSLKSIRDRIPLIETIFRFSLEHGLYREGTILLERVGRMTDRLIGEVGPEERAEALRLWKRYQSRFLRMAVRLKREADKATKRNPRQRR